MDKVAHVPQSVYLGDLLIAVNVMFDRSRNQIDVDRVRRALHAAEILDLVEAAPMGIWETVGERGVRLSVGQRQRLGIARAFYKNVELLILDEATSALDHEAESKILDAVQALGSRITVLTISHRDSVLRDCTRVLSLQSGGLT